MKKTLLIVLVIFALTTQAQVIPVTTGNLKEVFASVDSIASTTRHQLIKVDSAYDHRDLIGFKLSKASADTVTVLFVKSQSVYNFHEVRGKYADLFPIWKKYFNTSADAELLASKGGDYHKPKEGYSRIVFRKMRGYWVIKGI